MNPLAQALAGSPELFPAALDPLSGAVTLWRLSRADYEQSAFLDGRIAAGKSSRQVSFAELSRAVDEAGLRERCHFIFHIGHAGSTLLSRLLGRHPSLFSLREPDILRTLGVQGNQILLDSYLPVLLKLWSRTFDPAAQVVLKTTSFVSEIAPHLLSRSYRPKALAMGVAPEIYLATIFGGANAPAEARALAPMRLARLNRRLSTNWRVENLTVGEIVALGWACETQSLADAAQPANGRVLALDFEKFLAHSHETLRGVFAHFGLDPTESEISAMLAREMHSYSKAPEHPYDAETRRAVLAEGRLRHASDIRQGLMWLERVAEHPAIAGALGFFD
jgi:hypothetical protein